METPNPRIFLAKKRTKVVQKRPEMERDLTQDKFRFS